MRLTVSGRSNWATPPLGPLLMLCIAGLGVASVLQIVLEAAFDFSAMNTLPVFDLSQEKSVGTWFTTLLLVAAALSAAALAAVSPSRSAVRRGWLALAGLIVLLSLDEVVAMHERVGAIVQRAMNLPGALFLVWVVPAVLIVLAFGYWQRAFFAQLPRALRKRLLLAGATYVGAAAGLEVVESAIAVGGHFNTVAFSFVEVIEEVLELLAVTWAFLAMLDHCRTVAPVWTIRVDPTTPEIAANSDAPKGSRRFTRQRDAAPGLAAADSTPD